MAGVSELSSITNRNSAVCRVMDYLCLIGLKRDQFRIASHPKIDGAILYYVDFGLTTNSVPLNVALLVPSGKLYFPITNEVFDLNEKTDQIGKPRN